MDENTRWQKLAAEFLGTAFLVFVGVGSVPALLLVFDLPMPDAVGTSLVVIAVTSAVALVVRTGSDVAVDWPPVLALTGVAAVGAVLGGRVATRVDASRLQGAFALLVVVVAMFTTVRAAPGVLTHVPGLG